MANGEKRTLMDWAKIIGIFAAVIGGAGTGGVSLFGQQAVSDSTGANAALIEVAAKNAERQDREIDSNEGRINDIESNIAKLTQAQSTIAENQKELTKEQRNLVRGQDTITLRIGDILDILRSMQADSMVPRSDTSMPPRHRGPPHRGPRRP